MALSAKVEKGERRRSGWTFLSVEVITSARKKRHAERRGVVMRFHQRAAAVIAQEGFSGLLKRGARKLVKPFSHPMPAGPSAEDREKARQQALFPAQVASFEEQVRRR